MASSENQGLQIALIIFVMLTIILSVTTFVFFRQADEATIRSIADSKKATDADTALRDAIFTHPTMAEGLNVLFANPPVSVAK